MTIEDDHIAAQMRANRANGDSGGATQTNTDDGRITFGVAFRWFMGAIGSGLVIGVYWLVASVNEQNRDTDRILTRLEQQDKHFEASDSRLGRVEDDVKDLRGDVREIQGRVYRGGSMAEPIRGK